MEKAGRARHYRIAVASEHALVAQSVQAALADREFQAVAVRWPGGLPLPRNPHLPVRYDAGLLLGDLNRWRRLRAAMLLVSRTPTRWVVLTDAPRGPLWGAMYAAGARLVLPSTTTLDELEVLLPRLAAGKVWAPSAERQELTEAWNSLQAERDELSARIASLTPREREVLQLLHAGETVAGIASVLGVSTSTVRSQVKAVLRKLDVNSQLSAVAAYGAVLDQEPPPGADDGDGEPLHLRG